MRQIIKYQAYSVGLLALLFLTFANQASAQTVPNQELESIDGEWLKTEEVFPQGQVVLIVFWATWCGHTSTGLTTIQDDYLIEWENDYDLKIVAVSVDDAKSSNRAISVANSCGWEFDTFLDQNGDFKRAMGVSSAPHLILLNAEGQIAWRQSAYMSGDETKIEDQ